MKPTLLLSTLGVVMLLTTHTFGQSLYLAQSQETPLDAEQSTIFLEEASLYFIDAPEVRTIRVHDIVTIIIDENSSQISSQKLETDNKSINKASIKGALSLMDLLELRLAEGGLTDLDLIDFNGRRKYTGEGDYERKDKFTARIAAVVLEVKPNGTLVLQATKRIAKDKEVSVLVLSGLARDEDVTAQNTILSSQLANLDIILKNEGELKKAANKGFVTRILDTLFAF